MRKDTKQLYVITTVYVDIKTRETKKYYFTGTMREGWSSEEVHYPQKSQNKIGYMYPGESEDFKDAKLFTYKEAKQFLRENIYMRTTGYLITKVTKDQILTRLL